VFVTEKLTDRGAFPVCGVAEMVTAGGGGKTVIAMESEVDPPMPVAVSFALYVPNAV
jgi:hypothetical protein